MHVHICGMYTVMHTYYGPAFTTFLFQTAAKSTWPKRGVAYECLFWFVWCGCFPNSHLFHHHFPIVSPFPSSCIINNYKDLKTEVHKETVWVCKPLLMIPTVAHLYTCRNTRTHVHTHTHISMDTNRHTHTLEASCSGEPGKVIVREKMLSRVSYLFRCR